MYNNIIIQYNIVYTFSKVNKLLFILQRVSYDNNIEWPTCLDCWRCRLFDVRHTDIGTTRSCHYSALLCRFDSDTLQTRTST